jgi:hypothetical protein
MEPHPNEMLLAFPGNVRLVKALVFTGQGLLWLKKALEHRPKVYYLVALPV